MLIFMNSKYIFQIKKDNSIERVNLEDFEKIFEIKYLPFLKIEDQKLLKKIDKMCVNAGRNGDLTKENIWFGHFYERELKELSLNDFVKITTSRQRRCLKRGLPESHKRLVEKVKKFICWNNSPVSFYFNPVTFCF